MARFKGNAHDVYEQNADFIHEKSTLTKTVDEPSEHFHPESNISWSSDANITLDSPEIEERYNTVIHRKKFSIYGYGVYKGLITKYNRSLYGYSKNKSFMYVNLSGITTNTGLFFILPGSYLYYAGAIQIKVNICTMDVSQVEAEFEPATDRTFVVDPKGQTTQVSNTIVKTTNKSVPHPSGGQSNRKITTSQEFIRAKKAKYIGGLYVKRTTTKYLS